MNKKPTTKWLCNTMRRHGWPLWILTKILNICQTQPKFSVFVKLNQNTNTNIKTAILPAWIPCAATVDLPGEQRVEEILAPAKFQNIHFLVSPVSDILANTASFSNVSQCIAIVSQCSPVLASALAVLLLSFVSLSGKIWVQNVCSNSLYLMNVNQLSSFKTWTSNLEGKREEEGEKVRSLHPE